MLASYVDTLIQSTFIKVNIVTRKIQDFSVQVFVTRVSAVIVRAEGLALARLLSVSTHSNSPG